MNVAVIGAGKMGLPLACVLASRGARVLACDKRKSTVDLINAGKPTFDEPGLAEMLREVVESGNLTATLDTPAAVRESDVIVIIVPVLLSAGLAADLSIISDVTRQVAGALRKGAMVSYETTLPVGQTRKFGAMLEEGGLALDEDFDLVFSPERVKSQLVLSRLFENPKVVGGSTPRAALRGEEFYARYLGAPILNVGSLEAAEMVKLAGMTYRDVNIALANELANYSQAVGVRFEDVRLAANTDGEAQLLQPGIGVGGHCTPVYPHFLLRDAQARGAPLVISAAAREVNATQPAAVVSRVGDVAGKTAVILGLGFRPGVKESSHSPAFALRDALTAQGARVGLNDPLYSEEEIIGEGFAPAPIEGAEILILNTAHSEFSNVDFRRLAEQGTQVIVDGRNLWDPAAVRAVGIRYIGVGEPENDALPLTLHAGT